MTYQQSDHERARPPLVLASGSPRRRDLLAHLGLPFETVVSGVPEDVPPGVTPGDLVVALSQEKAETVAATRPGALVIGADTTVVCDGAILGKPVDAAEAVGMLRLLRDRWHVVYTGITVIDTTTRRSEQASVHSDVRLRAINDAEIAAYVATGEPLDRAGAYAIQGGAAGFIAAIDGCYNNVVGLPLCETTRLLARLGVAPRRDGPLCLLPSGAPCPRTCSPGGEQGAPGLT